jgi:hypothetical protein
MVAGKPSMPKERRRRLETGATRKSTGPKTVHYSRLGSVGGDNAEVDNIVSLLE